MPQFKTRKKDKQVFPVSSGKSYRRKDDYDTNNKENFSKQEPKIKSVFGKRLESSLFTESHNSIDGNAHYSLLINTNAGTDWFSIRQLPDGYISGSSIGGRNFVWINTKKVNTFDESLQYLESNINQYNKMYKNTPVGKDVGEWKWSGSANLNKEVNYHWINNKFSPSGETLTNASVRKDWDKNKYYLLVQGYGYTVTSKKRFKSKEEAVDYSVKFMKEYTTLKKGQTIKKLRSEWKEW